VTETAVNDIINFQLAGGILMFGEGRIFYADIDPYDVDKIQLAIEERIGKQHLFVGRQKELQYLLKWLDNIPEKMSKSTALLARRKKGKTAIVERLYNIIFSQNGPVIPFYYEIYERKEWLVDFSNKDTWPSILSLHF
jgi:hypothetical protein